MNSSGYKSWALNYTANSPWRTEFSVNEMKLIFLGKLQKFSNFETFKYSKFLINKKYLESTPTSKFLTIKLLKISSIVILQNDSFCRYERVSFSL
jgi:hypothetical protein